jgi:hypothetical protein
MSASGSRLLQMMLLNDADSVRNSDDLTIKENRFS